MSRIKGLNNDTITSPPAFNSLVLSKQKGPLKCVTWRIRPRSCLQKLYTCSRLDADSCKNVCRVKAAGGTGQCVPEHYRSTEGPYMLQWKQGEKGWGGGDSCSLELYVHPPSPHLCSTMEALPAVPTHKEFLRHCWVRHDNWVLNKAFLLGILLSLVRCEEGGQQSKEGGRGGGGA